MNKFLICLLLLSITLFFGSCMGTKNIFINSTKKADARMEQIFEAINEQDKEAIKQMFSKNLLNKTEDIDTKIDYLFSLIQGEPESWEGDAGPVISEDNNYTHRTRKLSVCYYLKTDTEEYIIMFRDCTLDTDNPENVGLFMLNAVLKSDEKDSIWGTPIIGEYKTDEEKS